MKAPKPRPPSDLPPGSIQIGGPIDWFSISVIVKDEWLDPEVVTTAFGRAPDRAWQKDKPLLREDGTLKRVPKFGAWFAVLKQTDTDEWDCAEAMMELLSTFPEDPKVWCDMAGRYTVSLSVGLSLESSGREFELSPRLMSYLSERHITVCFDVYINGEKSA